MLNRQNLILFVGVAAIAGTLVNAWFPRQTDPRRHSLGRIDGRSLGSIEVPYGWRPFQNQNNAPGVLTTEFRSRYGTPSILAKAGPDLEAQLDIPENSSKLLAKASLDVSYYDASRRLQWTRRLTRGRDQTREVVTVRFHDPPQLEMVFTNPDSRLSYDSTIIHIVDSYAFLPPDPEPPQRKGSGENDDDENDGAKSEFVLADLQRQRQALWICGAIVILLPLVLIERRLAAKQQLDFERELSEHRQSMEEANRDDDPATTADSPNWQDMAKRSDRNAGEGQAADRPSIPFDDDDD